MFKKLTAFAKPLPSSAPAYLPSHLSSSDIDGLPEDLPDPASRDVDGHSPYYSEERADTSSSPHLIHTTNLPNIKKCLDHALTVLDTDISPWTNPSGWIQVDAHHIHSIIKGVAAIVDNTEIEFAIFNCAMIYQVSRALTRALHL
jgi:hypothetical protein